MRLDAVRAWRDHLRHVDVARVAPHLSESGARGALDAALDALHDEALAAAVALPGPPYDTTTVVCARTVFTAPLEWCAVLLARGTRVWCKLPAGVPGLGPAMAEHAVATGLPLVVTDDRAAVQQAELVVAMGSDDTVHQVRASVGPEVRVLGFGHRYSVAWIREADSLAGVAVDAALHDGAGCMSPVAVFTDLPRAVVLDALAEAMTEAQERWPRGPLAAADAAQIRARGALARVVGSVRAGEGWALHALPPDRFLAAALPRTLAVHCVDGPEAVAPILTGPLSTIGTDDPERWRSVPGVRVCAPGQMQRPPLDRLHDGVDWLRETIRPAGS